MPEAGRQRERQDAAEPAAQILGGVAMLRMGLEPRVGDPLDPAVRGQPPRDRQRVVRVALNPERQGLQALKE